MARFLNGKKTPLRDEDVPEPGAPLDEPDPEFDAAIARFMAMQKEKGWKRYVWSKGADHLILTPEGIKLE